MYRAACCLLVILAAASAAGVVTAGEADADSTTATTTNNATTETATLHRTMPDPEGSFGGFTLGAAILAVVAAGSYRYFRG